MMHDDDGFDPEEEFADRDRTQGIHGTPGGDGNGAHGRRGADAVTGLVEDDFTGIDLVAEKLGDGAWNLADARVVTVDDDALQWHGMRERFAHRRLIEAGLGTEYEFAEPGG